jgi:hypothetical protein
VPVKALNKRQLAQKARRIRYAFSPAILALHLHQRLGGWREVAAYIGDYSPAYWSLVGKGHQPTKAAEDALRRALGYPPRGVTHWAQMRVRDVRRAFADRRVVYHAQREAAAVEAVAS